MRAPRAEQPPRAQARPTSPRAGGLLLGVGIGTALYALIVTWLFAVGMAEPIAGGEDDRLVISAALLVIAATTLMAAARRAGAVRAGRAAIGVGVALELLSLIDMHVVGAFELAGGNPLVDVAFHGAGPLIAVVGALLELRPMRHAPSVAIGLR